MTLSVASERKVTVPGDRFAVAVRFVMKSHYHIWPNNPEVPAELADLSPIATVISAGEKGVAGVTLQADRTLWPEADQVSVGFSGKPVTIKSYEKPFTAFVPVVIAADAKPGEVTLPIIVNYQACDDKVCYRPEEMELAVKFTIAAAGTATVNGDMALFATLDRAAFVDSANATPTRGTTGGAGSSPATTPPSSVVNFGAFGIDLKVDTAGGVGLALVAIVAFFGGVLLNFVPCVLPVIPIKIMGLQQAAGKSRTKMLLYGLITAAGVVAFWLAGGVLVALAVIGALSQLVSFWWFNMAIALIILGMGLGMFGLFQTGLPQWVYNVSPSHDKPSGSFLFGVLHAVLSIPCIAPLGGAAMAWAATQKPGVTILVFGAIGLGMSTPYLLLSGFPKSVNWIPRAGPASDLLKQVMALLMIAAGLFFLGTALLSLVAEYPYLAKVLHWWAVAIVIGAAGLWLAARILKVGKGTISRVVMVAIGLVMLVSGVSWARFQTGVARAEHENRALWREYDPAEYDRAIADGKTVVLDFTAEWCINCKILEASVLATDDVRAAIKQPAVVAFKADVTARNAPGWARLKTFDRNGIPLLVITGPGLSEPWLSEAYTPTSVIEAVSRATQK